MPLTHTHTLPCLINTSFKCLKTEIFTFPSSWNAMAIEHAWKWEVFGGNFNRLSIIIPFGELIEDYMKLPPFSWGRNRFPLFKSIFTAQPFPLLQFSHAWCTLQGKTDLGGLQVSLHCPNGFTRTYTSNVLADIWVEPGWQIKAWTAKVYWQHCSNRYHPLPSLNSHLSLPLLPSHSFCLQSPCSLTSAGAPLQVSCSSTEGHVAFWDPCKSYYASG